MRKRYIGIDIGGSYLKGVVVEWSDDNNNAGLPQSILNAPVVKSKSNLGAEFTVNHFKQAIVSLLEELAGNEPIASIGISTAGVVDYAGKRLTLVAPHLSQLMDESWITFLHKKYKVPVVLINDADAAAIGAAQLGYLAGYKTIGIMPIGTGVGLTVWRNGRKWTPFYDMTLLGSCFSYPMSYDNLLSASHLAEMDSTKDLSKIFTLEEHRDLRKMYIEKLIGVIRTAHTLYHINELLLGGGLASAVTSAEYPLAEQLNNHLTDIGVKVRVLSEGNALPLIGAVLLGKGEQSLEQYTSIRHCTNATTERPFDEDLQLNQLETRQMVRLFWKLEQESGERLQNALDSLSSVVDQVTERLRNGGRLIYVGAGTSGRLATVDTVEIGCTFGFPREKVLTLVAGGVADAAFDIETHFEEDACCVPELLLLNLTEKDVVIGISVSGSAYYVQSALGYAKSIGALSILIQESGSSFPDFCNQVIPLHSGSELIAGSTRMKAGTATKKVINFISTSVMIKLGNVYGCYMVNLECINIKLIHRAISILMKLFNLDSEQAEKILSAHHYKLKDAVATLANRKSEGN